MDYVKSITHIWVYEFDVIGNWLAREQCDLHDSWMSRNKNYYKNNFNIHSSIAHQ